MQVQRPSIGVKLIIDNIEIFEKETDALACLMKLKAIFNIILAA